MKYKIFVSILFLQITLILLLMVDGIMTLHRVQPKLEANRKLAVALQLTDLAIWTEARYTRHPTQTDFFSPFQDFPACIEHFPAGTIMAPPPAIQGMTKTTMTFGNNRRGLQENNDSTQIIATGSFIRHEK